MSKSKQPSHGPIPAGGPATINGVLYQLLWSLLRVSRATINSISTNAAGEFKEVFLTLEPAEGGGDLVVTDQMEKVGSRPSLVILVVWVFRRNGGLERGNFRSFACRRLGLRWSGSHY